MSSTNDAQQAADIQSGLFRQYAAAGIPILKGTQGYIRGALEAEPAYIAQAYRGARGGALEEGLAESRGPVGGTGGRYLANIAGQTAAGGAAIAAERGNQAMGQGLASIDRTNSLLRLLAGQGAQSADLSVGFGSLGNRAMGIEAANFGNNFNLGAGMVSAGTQGYLGWLANRTPQPGGVPNYPTSSGRFTVSP